jgi:hypothetical protein
VSPVIFAKREPAGRSTREIAPLPNALGLRLTWSLSGCVGVEFNPEVGVGVGVGRETTEGDMMRERGEQLGVEREKVNRVL